VADPEVFVRMHAYAAYLRVSGPKITGFPHWNWSKEKLGHKDTCGYVAAVRDDLD